MGVKEELAERYDADLLFADGLDHAILGVVERCGQEPFVLYDADLAIDGFMAGGMTREEAEEHYAFNVAGAWVGPQTPGFVRVLHRGEPGE